MTGDFLKFAAHYGASRGSAEYDPGFDLDSDGEIGFRDVLHFADSYGTGG